MTRPRSAVALAQEFITPSLSAQGVAVDATAGNGNDSVFLSQYLAEGLVYSFDIQQEALHKTAKLLEQKGLLERVKLILSGHEQIDQYVNTPLNAVMFNLGYLPGGDHNIITRPQNTITALQKSLQLLRVGGRISLVVYTGHSGGGDELKAVEELLRGLDSRSYWVTSTKFINRPDTAPRCFFVERMI